MLGDDRRHLVDALQQQVGERLRVVAEYCGSEHEIFYARDDVERRLPYTADNVHEELILRGIGRDHLEEIFDAGTLHCSMHRFDELTAFHFLRDDFSGLFVSVDSDAEVDLAAFTAECKEYL